MITTNPFAGLAEYGITPGMMMAFVILMVLAVVVGTALDVLHKKSHKYFFEHEERMKKLATRELSSAEKTSMLIQTITSEVLTSSEFHNPKRRLAHLLKMYGFVLFVLSSAVLIFAYPTTADAPFWAFLWHLGAIMVAIGGYWFFFSLRVDVQSEGNKWWNLKKRDLFIVSLLATVTFGLLWSLFGTVVLFALFIISTAVLFGSVYWSKFAHMFFKPAAAYQKRKLMADGSRENLPPFYKRAEVLDQSTMDLVRDIPKDQKFGLCIMKDEPKHY